MSSCKTILFSRPVQVADIDWQIEVPVQVIERGEEAVIKWIMANKDKLYRLGTFPEVYSLKDALSPEKWDEWEVTITPAINIEDKECHKK